MSKPDSPSSQYARDDVASNHTQDLTTDELQDLALAATAQSEPEAIALEDRLEDAGIPVCTRGGITLLGVQEPRKIWVPRKLLKSAQETIDEFRAQNPPSANVIPTEDRIRERDRLKNDFAVIGWGGLSLAGAAVIFIAVLLYVTSFFVEGLDRIAIIFGVPTMIAGLCVVLAAKHRIKRRRN
jgi:hypothetical protein